MILLPLSVFLCFGYATEFLSHEQKMRKISDRRQETVRAADTIRGIMESEINASAYLANGIESYIVARHGAIRESEVESMLKLLHERGRHIRNIGLGPGNRMTQIVPLVGNEKAIGLYFPDNPAQWPAVNQIIQERKPRLVGPINLVQGGVGLIYHIPVFSDGKYWGLISTVIDMNSLFTAMERLMPEHTGQIAVRGRDGTGANGEAFYGDPRLFGTDSPTMDVTVPGGKWQLAVKLPDVVPYLPLVRIFGWIATLLLTAMGIILLRVFRRQGELMQNVSAQNKLLQDAQLESIITYKKLQQLVSAVEHSPTAIVITDHDGLIEYVNPKFTEITGYSSEEALGHNPGILKSGAHTKEYYREMWDTICAGHDWVGEFCNKKKNGELFWEHASISPIKNKQGVITHFVAIKEDVTKQRQIARELLESEGRFQRMVSTAPAMLYDYILSPDGIGRFLYVSPNCYDILEVDDKDLLLDMNLFWNMVHSDDIERLHGEDVSANLAGHTFVAEVRIITKSERMKWVQLSSRSNPAVPGEPTIWSGYLLDITWRKKAEEELKAAKEAADESNRLKSRFLANMSHEIRTPLNAIIGFSGITLKTSLSLQQHDYIEKIQTAGESLLNIINDILDSSKIEAGKLHIEHIPFSLNRVVANAFSMVQQKATDKGLKLRVEIQPEISACLVGDPHRLGQVIINLLSNAVKFTEQGEVLFEALLLSEQKDRVQLKFSVHDTGIGILPEQIEKLFQSFTQADCSTTRSFGGTGLGLSVSKQLVELMEGEIGCESAPDKGSTFNFTVWLDIGHENDTGQFLRACIENVQEGELSFDYSGSCILLVEDNLINQKLVIELLKDTGIDVHVAKNGREAVSMITNESTTYDLILMDIQMPVMDGNEATRRIRSDNRFVTLPIIAMTAHAMLEEQQRFIQDGMNAYISKPINSRIMMQTISTFLRKRKTCTPHHEIFRSATNEESAIPTEYCGNREFLLTRRAVVDHILDIPVVTPILKNLQGFILGRECQAERYLDQYAKELAALPENGLGQIRKHLKVFNFATAHEALLSLADTNGITLL